jgi:uncharacterized cupin superfamily protein
MNVARLDPDGEDRFQRLREDLGVQSMGVNLLRLQPLQRGRIHRHARQEEVYVVLEGTLTLLVEGAEHELTPGLVARVGPAERRQLVNASSERVVLLAFGAAGEHASRDGEAFESWEQEPGRPPQEVPLPGDLDSSAS